MPSKALLNTKLWPKVGLDHAPSLNAELQRDAQLRAELAPQLLLYDQLIIPTADFGIVPVLAEWLGIPLLCEALQSDSLKFVRYQGSLGYCGNGNAVSAFVIQEGDGRKFQWWQRAMFGSTRDALGEQLEHSLPQLTGGERNGLYDLVLRQTSDFAIPNDEFIRNVANESYTDVLNSHELLTEVQQHYQKKHPNKEKIDLRWLPEIGPNQVRVSTLKQLQDPVDLVLRIAELNLGLCMSVKYASADLFTPEQTAPLLRSKLQRTIPAIELQEGFMQLLQLSGVPDVQAGVSAGDITFGALWNARSTENAIQFRRWLRDAGVYEAADLTKAYIASLEKVPAVSSLPSKTLRFLATTAVGLTSHEPLGAITSVLNSFFVEKWLGGYTPRVFIDEMRKFKIEPQLAKARS